MNSEMINSMYDGIIVLQSDGKIREMNESAISLLGVDSTYIGKRYIDIMVSSDNMENDEFHQTLLDAIKEKKNEKSSIRYVKKDGSEVFVNITVLKLENGEFCIVFKDITDEIKERKLKDEYVRILIIIMGFCSACAFGAAAWIYFDYPISQEIISKLIVLAAFLGFLYLFRFTTLEFENVGLSFKGKKNAIITDTIMTAICAAVMIAGKAIIMVANPDYTFYTDGSFIMWDKYPLYTYFTYMVSVFGQEFVARSMLHESFAKIIPNDNREIKAILVSSLIFGALHIYIGFIYMVAAFAYLCIFGFIYSRQRCLWGLCIPHFVLGELIGLLGYVNY